MGTATSAPMWVAEVEIIESLGITQRQLYEDFDVGFFQRMGKLNELRKKADAMKGRGSVSAPSNTHTIRRTFGM